MAAVPIWKDLIIDLGAFAALNYRVRVGSSSGDIIYSGRAYRRPGETNIHIKVNDICADYLHNTLPAMTQAEFSELEFPLEFYVQREYQGSWTTVKVVEFNNDWSYDDSYRLETMGMSFPITARIDKRQWIIFTAYKVSDITATLTMRDGTTVQVIVPVEISPDFNFDYNADFARSLRAAGSGTAFFDLAPFGDVVSVIINGKTWDVVTDCKEWVLYYVNAFGGWDSLLIEGLTKEQDNLTRHTRQVEYSNDTTQNRGKKNFVNEIEKVFTMNTSWLSDEQSARMHHLLNSTDVYLYNINTNELLPVILNNTTTEYKTYKSNGARLVNYQIEATIAQDRIRR